MADDNTQRPYRSGASGGTSSGNDPLAELARLIGQNDPFGEYGRAGGQRAAPQPPAPQPEWPHQAATPETVPPPHTASPEAPPLFGAPPFGRSPFGGGGYQPQHEAADYAATVPGYAPLPPDDYEPEEAYLSDQPDEYAAVEGGHDDYYDEEDRAHRRRFGIIAIAAVFALAVVGTAAAFGYRAIFGSSSESGPPPVIKADTTPSKIVPASAGKDAQASKMITDRVNERGEGEKLVSREEQPVAITPVRPVNPASMPDQQAAASVAPANALPQLGSGVVGTEPKRIRTVSIHPDGSSTPAAPEAAAPPEPVAPPAQPRPTAAPAAAPVRTTQPKPPVVHQATAPAPRAPVQREPAPANAPLSLSPNAAPPQRTATVAPPTRLAPQPAAPAVAASGGYAVQVTARRSEADAQAAFRALQGKYPDQLGGRSPLIKRVDLGAKGIYFRAMVGPFGSSAEASQVCASLKAAGGSCLIQKI